MMRFATDAPGAVETHELARDRTLRIEPRRARVIVEARAGTCLVTQEGDAEDHVVVPGSAFTSRPRGVVAVWALTRATITIARARLDPMARKRTGGHGDP